MRPRRWYQTECAAYSAQHPCAGIFMDKRLGKIASTFDWALAHRRKNILISTPLSAVPGWLDDAEADGLRAVLMYGSQTERQRALVESVEKRDHDAPEDALFAIINPEGLYRSAGSKILCDDCDGLGGETVSGQWRSCSTCGGRKKVSRGEPEATEIALMHWDAVVWDETVSLKNPKAQITRVAHAAFRNCTHRLGLSGEYAPEGAEDIFEQMRWIFGSFMGYNNYWRWRHHYFDNAGYDWRLKPGARAEIKDAVHARCFVLSRADAGIPEEKTFERRWCDLPQKVRTAYDHAEKYFELPYNDDGEMVETKYGLVPKTWLGQLAGGYPSEFPNLQSDHKCSLLLELLNGPFRFEKVVVIFRFNSELEGVAQRLRKHNIIFTQITGATPPEERRKRQHAFNIGNVNRILMQIKVAKYGVNLAGSSTMIRYSLSDPWDDISQSMDRIVDPGNPKVYAYIDLCARDTIDEDRLNALGDKGIDARYYMSKFRDLFTQRTTLKEQTHA